MESFHCWPDTVEKKTLRPPTSTSREHIRLSFLARSIALRDSAGRGKRCGEGLCGDNNVTRVHRPCTKIRIASYHAISQCFSASFCIFLHYPYGRLEHAESKKLFSWGSQVALCPPEATRSCTHACRSTSKALGKFASDSLAKKTSKKYTSISQRASPETPVHGQTKHGGAFTLAKFDVIPLLTTEHTLFFTNCEKHLRRKPSSAESSHEVLELMTTSLPLRQSASVVSEWTACENQTGEGATWMVLLQSSLHWLQQMAPLFGRSRMFLLTQRCSLLKHCICLHVLVMQLLVSKRKDKKNEHGSAIEWNRSIRQNRSSSFFFFFFTHTLAFFFCTLLFASIVIQVALFITDNYFVCFSRHTFFKKMLPP